MRGGMRRSTARCQTNLKSTWANCPSSLYSFTGKLRMMILPSKRILRPEIEVGAKQLAEHPAQKTISHAGKGRDDHRTGFLGKAGKLSSQ